MLSRARFWMYGALGMGSAMLLFLLVWIWMMFSVTPFSFSVAKHMAWPIACSSRGCVTTTDWARQYSLSERYTTITKASGQTPAEALTTTIHHYLLAHAFFKSPVTLADASRYRQEVLHVENGNPALGQMGISEHDYDQYVVLPFLQQEALRAEYNLSSPEEVYQKLSSERFLLFFLQRYRWDTEKGIATAK